jgi:hypothetical protein
MTIHAPTQCVQEGLSLLVRRLERDAPKLRINVIITTPPSNGRAVEALICGRSLAGVLCSNPPGHGCLPVVSVLCCQVEVSALS